ncbi:MAG: hypothetical protein ABH969_10895, partial [Pseudomonadota bacterium]
EEVHYSEIDPLIIQMIGENLTPLTRQEIKDSRVRIHALDGRLFVKTTTQKFDLVLLNLPGPSTLELNRYYTVESFGEIFHRLTEKGVLALSAPGSEAYLGPEVRDLNLSLILSLREVFPAVHVIPGNVNFILASASAEAESPLSELFISRLREREISTQFLTDFQIRFKLQKHRQKWLEDSLRRGGPVRLNRDANPAGLYYGIAYWNAQFHPFLQNFWGGIKELRLWHLALPVFLLFWVPLVMKRKRASAWRKGALIWVVATTGFFGISFSVLLIFSFQTLYGNVYQWIGLLIAAFMGGVALGSWTMTWILERIRNFVRTLYGVEILIISWATLGIALLDLLYSRSLAPGSLWAAAFGFFMLNGMAGLLVGVEFPLSNGIFMKSEEGVGRTAGILYGADLFGAWAGSLLVGVLLIPVLGILQTWALVICLKLASLLLVVIVLRR